MRSRLVDNDDQYYECLMGLQLDIMFVTMDIMYMKGLPNAKPRFLVSSNVKTAKSYGSFEDALTFYNGIKEKMRMWVDDE